MSIKRMMGGLFGLAIAQILITGCEKSVGPDPYLCEHNVNQVQIMSTAATGSVPLMPAIPFNILEKLIVNDAVMLPVIIGEEDVQNFIPLEQVRKIVFVP